MNVPLKKRFWKDVTVQPEGTGYAVFLDNRQLKTPKKSSLLLPNKALADGVAAEWDAIEGKINPLAMHLTRCANATIDKVVFEREAVGDMLTEYGGTDLLCYRAETPAALVERQAAAWDPLLDWAAQTFDARLLTAEGVMHIPQPPEAIENLRAAVQEHSAWEMTALHDLVTISGSLVLGLAVSKGHIAGQDAWPLSRIDETWQEEFWGVDDEATEMAANKRSDFLKAEHLLQLVRG